MKRTFFLSIVIIFAVLCPESAKAQKERWASEKYKVFLTCLIEQNDYDGVKSELEKLSRQGDD